MQHNYQHVSNWLALLAGLIIAIIILGGYTRLSGAGLSIVEWKPIVGILPPLNQIQWDVEFSKYKLFPEYKIINSGLSLQDFKFIFMIEFLHRTLARIIGIILVVPMLYFYKKKYLKQQDMPKYYLMLAILLLQGFVGWYMVKSGLSQNPHVSHYRLATHLMIAMIFYSIVISQIIPTTISKNNQLRSNLKLLLLLVYIQTLFGALVAGLKAGLIYNSFPLMGQHFIPDELNSFNLNDPISVQFIHRILAYIIVLVALYLSKKLYQNNTLQNTMILLIPSLLQIGIGIATLILQVPIILALAHQIGAIILISSIIYLTKTA